MIAFEWRSVVVLTDKKLGRLQQEQKQNWALKRTSLGKL